MSATSAPETAAEGRFAGRRLLALGTFDSFVKTAAQIGRLFEAEGASMRVAALAAEPGQLTARQLRAGGVHETVPVVAAETLVGSRLFRDAQLVIAVVDGGRARELFLSLAAADLSREPSRPVVAVASPGVVLADHLAGFMSRAPADVLCFNTEADRALYVAAAAEIGVDSTNAVVTGLLGMERRPWSPPSGRPTVIFFEQPVIPARRMQRAHLLAGLAELARRFPQADVLVKLRHGRDERAHHATRFHLEDIARELFARGGRPKNLSFTHDPAHELLDRASLAVTVSSTIAVEAMARGVPTRIVSDFGISELLGTTYFVGSGCFAALAELRPDMAAVVRPEWLANSGAVARPEVLLDQCAALLGGQDRLGAALPRRPLTPAYGSPDWMGYALGRGGPMAVHAPHLLEKPRRGLGFVAAVANRLKEGRRFVPRG
ncbi:DUF6716 putative glycosyltransferase [Hansschlegelia sp.]|uniref:DUF6716 putative glycosyltransferase n=1 Tax=Hansschlegelia sp. TaxID=2041892 RepID=UPI002BC43E40|nr:DUF6716 putative glycosyltransferase [Hansschlegelia sp.]HVI28371.1 DUF6716 putative glycosyltransferase [Hansschlegelia sp.]